MTDFWEEEEAGKAGMRQQDGVMGIWTKFMILKYMLSNRKEKKTNIKRTSESFLVSSVREGHGENTYEP